MGRDQRVVDLVMIGCDQHGIVNSDGLGHQSDAGPRREAAVLA